MVINMFVKDATNKSNPLVRALAVRTMGCLRVANLNAYLVDPLMAALKDTDPYVKKTALLCVPKVYELTPNLVEENKMIETIQKVLSTENNSMVIANAVIALAELSELSGSNLVKIDNSNIEKILGCLSECMDWGQVFVLDNLMHFKAKDEKMAEKIIDKVLPRLSHINAAVVLSGLKVVIKFMGSITNKLLIQGLCKKLTSPVSSLVNGEQETNGLC